MTSHLRCFVRLYLLLALSVAQAASASDSQWVEIKSPHFSVVTDAGEKRGRETAMRFEQMRAVFGALMSRANMNLPIPLQIVAFRNARELAQFSPLWNGKPVTLNGLFQSAEDRSFIMLDMSTEDPWRVVFHEYAHQLMNGVLTVPVDPWFEEGFAEYFSSIEVDGKEALVGKIPEYEYQVLQRDGMMKVSDLFRVRKDSPTYNESGNHRSVFYAESGMIVHFLYDNNLIPRLSAYFEMKLDKNVSVEEAMRQTLGWSALDFDGEIRNYISSGRFKYFPIPTPSNIVSGEYVARTLSPADSGAILADVHLHSPDYHEKAIAEFREILKAQPNHAAACRGLGYAYLRKRDFDQAREYLKRAAEADSRDPRVHYYSALLMRREGAFTRKSDLPEMISHLNTAIALDPTFADPYMLLAFAQMYEGDPAKGLVTMQKAVSLSPRNENYQFNLAQMYLNNQKSDPAIAILQELSRSGNAEQAEMSGGLLAEALRFKEESQERQVADPDARPDTDEKATGSGSIRIGKSSAAEQEVSPGGSSLPFLQGTIVGVDCSSPPAATLTVVSQEKTWKMQVRDIESVLLIGADSFSCDWSRQRVELDYRATGDAAGNVISIEIE